MDLFEQPSASPRLDLTRSSLPYTPLLFAAGVLAAMPVF
jgi:hypothetical protein